MFPAEILEKIFSQLPLVDLVAKSLVCKQWHEIICREKFLLWKKTYHKYVSGKDKNSEEFVSETCQNLGISSVSDCLAGLVRFITQWKTDGQDPSPLTFLSRHAKYSLAEDILKERLPGVPEETISPWALVAIICCTSKDVADIYSLFNILIHPKSNTTATEVLETLYCICTFLLHFRQAYHAPSRCHYNLYYALQLYENCWLVPQSRTEEIVPSSSQENSTDLHLTYEQMKIIKHPLQQNELIRIVALAGTGKTTTLLEFSKSRPSTKFLFVAFNKSVQMHANKIFPRHVLCKTAHSLAWSEFGYKYKNQIKKTLTSNGIVKSYVLKSVEHDKSENLYQRADLALKTVSAYLVSRDPVISLQHVPHTVVNNHTGEIQPLMESRRQAVIKDADAVWRAMCDAKNTNVPMSHDGYLKLWQLSKPNLVSKLNIDCILLDEGQDLSTAMLDVFLNQQCARIIVGDPHQQIYQFRGAINAMSIIDATHTFYLTQSFRFGSEIGFLANSCLEVFKKVKNRFLIGGRERDELGTDVRDSTPGQFCIIGRTRLGIYKKVVELLCPKADANATSPPKVAFVGGYSSYSFDKMLEAWYLRSGEIHRVTDSFLKNWVYEGYAKLKMHATSYDPELLATLCMMEWSGSHTPAYVSALKERITDNIEEADIVFTTAHKSKGLEWNTVALLDDFLPEFSASPTPMNEEAAAEANLLYVAVTRARQRLFVNSACFYTLLHVNDKQERLVSTDEYISRNPAACCPQCSKPIQRDSNKAVSIQISRLHLENGFVFQNGILCSVCAAAPFYPVLVLTSYKNHVLPRFRDDNFHLFYQGLVGPQGDEMAGAQYLYDHEYKERLAQYFQAFRYVSKFHPIVVEVLDSDSEDELMDVMNVIEVF